MKIDLLKRLLLIVIICSGVESFAAGFEFKDGDRVALIGNTFTERAQQYGYIESYVTAANPGKHVVFRNLGWSGDNVHGESRAYFGSREDGFKHLVKYMNQVKPTVIVFAYGSNAAFKGEAGMKEFVGGMERLIGEAKKTKARLVLVSPTPLEKISAAHPDQTKHNKKVSQYTLAVQELANKHGAAFVDLFNYLQSKKGNLTYNGIHYTSKGYHAIAPIYAKQLGVKTQQWGLHLTVKGEVRSAVGTSVKQMTRQGETGLKFALLDDRLPNVLLPNQTEVTDVRQIRVDGLPEGRYLLKIDGKEVGGGTAKDFAAGKVSFLGPEREQVEQLRKTIVEKNELFFHGYRPQNETYLRGFRKHEQGNNAVEIGQFKQYVEAKEKLIAELRQPKVRQYEIVSVK